MNFSIELIIPIFLLGLFFVLTNYALKKLNKYGKRWATVFSILALVMACAAWLALARHSNNLQCIDAYGDMASDPEMCDNSANGFVLILQMSILFVSWIGVTILAFIKFRSFKINTVTK